MEVTIGKHKFKLEKVSILISEMYSDLTQLAFDHADVESDIELVQADYDEDMELAEGRIDEIRAKRKRLLALKDIRKQGKERADEMAAKRMDMLREILILNGYDFEYDLWRTKANTETVNDIIVELVGGKGKKKET